MRRESESKCAAGGGDDGSKKKKNVLACLTEGEMFGRDRESSTHRGGRDCVILLLLAGGKFCVERVSG